MEKLTDNSRSSLIDTDKLINTKIRRENKIIIDLSRNIKIDIKYPTFSIPAIDEELKYEITYENLMNDLGYVSDLLEYYLDTYTNILITNPHNILVSFQKYKLNFLLFHINSFLLKRHIELLSFLIKYKFEECEKTEAKLKENFLDKSLDEIILMWTGNEKYKGQIFENIEDALEIRESFKNGKETETFLLDVTLSTKDKPSLSGLGIFIKYFKYVLQSAIETMKIITKKESEDNMLNFFQDCTKLKIMNMFMKTIFKVPNSDLFNLNENSEEWQKLKKNYNVIIAHSDYRINKKLKTFHDLVIMSNAALSSGYRYKQDYLNVLGTGFFMAFYFFNSKGAQIAVKKFSLNPDHKIALKMWNFLDTKGIKQLYTTSLPGVAFRKKLYVLKQQREINKNLLADLINGIKANKLDSIFDPMLEFDKSTEREITDLKVSKSLYKTALSKSDVDDYVKIKILHNYDFYIPGMKKSWLFNCCVSKMNNTRNSLIIHIHGGGFIAMSSSTHENYLRKWTKQLGVPIFSIDYRLAPEHPYPKSLDDVWQAYNWIIDNAKQEFDINLDKIILVGDSAGGNLVLGLVYLLIIMNKRVPDSIFLAYPGCRVNFEYFHPSYLLTLQDKILPFHFIKFCIDCYTGNYEQKEDDPFLNPILMDPQVVKKMPPVKLFFGSSDPLRDDSINLAHKLIQLDMDCQIFEFKYFPHGFLNYDLPHLIPEAKIANDIIIQEMEKVFSSEI